MALSSRARIAENFIVRHGPEGLRRLLDALSEGRSGQAIADDFAVSRERVRQWKNAFGHSVTLYQVHPEVLRVLREQDAEGAAHGEPDDGGPAARAPAARRGTGRGPSLTLLAVDDPGPGR